MESFLEWLRCNYTWLITAFVSLVSLVFLIIKKRVKVVDFLTGYLEVLPSFIIEAEKLLKTGTDKYSYVTAKSVQYLSSVTGLEERTVIIDYSSFINNAIESILSAPQKKEDK